MLSPLDSRYFDKLKDLDKFYSEEQQTILKTQIEIDYFILLCKELKLKLTEDNKKNIRYVRDSIHVGYIKLKEENTKHDIKAIEYYLRDRFNFLDIPHSEYIHFGLTSQDINSLATSYSLKLFNEYYINLFSSLISVIEKFAQDNDCVFPARTHGQLAVPTSFKKEIQVFVNRLSREKEKIKNYKFDCKFGGAVGNLSAHKITFPDKLWNYFMDSFVSGYGLNRSQTTTQVDNNASISEYFDILRRINNILIDFCRDIWMYNSYGYFKQNVLKEEIGSSTMPQKINPINFENAEGNLEISNCLLQFMSNKLQISRMQRDLTDTTVVRNIGVALGHVVVSFKSIMTGLEKLSINYESLKKDITENCLLHEAYQVVLKANGIQNGYEIIKEMTRNNKAMEDLNIPETLKDKLKNITTKDYL